VDLLRDLKRRGMRAPMIAVGDGALGFWAALRDVWPTTREQRDWVHMVANTLDALPRSVQPTAKKMLAQIRDAEDRDHTVAAAKRFDAEFRPLWPKAADKISTDLDRLLTFYDFPAEHWLHLKRRIRSSRPSPRCGYAPRSPRGPAPEPPGWPWPTS
jgi:transposase-like protein